MGTILIRNAAENDAPALARILVEATQDTFQGLVPDKCLTSWTCEQSEKNWRKTLRQGGLAPGTFLLVAMNPAKEVVGYALAGRDPQFGGFERELNVLMVDPVWQRRGIGRKLVSYVALELKKQDVKSLLIGIQEDNPNKKFYEHLGGQVVGTRPLEWEGYATKEILYGWQNIEVLVG